MQNFSHGLNHPLVWLRKLVGETVESEWGGHAWRRRPTLLGAAGDRLESWLCMEANLGNRKDRAKFEPRRHLRKSFLCLSATLAARSPGFQRMAPKKSMRPYKSPAEGWGVPRATGLALTEEGIAMGAVWLGFFLPLGCSRDGSVPGSAIPAGTHPLDQPIIDTLSWRERLGKSRWFELFAVMAPPCLFAVLAGSTTDAGSRLFLICLAIYSDALIALLWFVEKDGAQTESALSHPRPWRTARCAKGQRDDRPQFLQPVDASEIHGRRSARHLALRGDLGGILDHRHLRL